MVVPLVARVSRSVGTLAGRVAALDEAVALARGRLPDSVLETPTAVVARARDRAALSGEYTVVALAGATGSGKSSLLNALADARIAEPGLASVTPGSGEIRIDPVSVCHQVSTTGVSPEPIVSRYQT